MISVSQQQSVVQGMSAADPNANPGLLGASNFSVSMITAQNTSVIHAGAYTAGQQYCSGNLKHADIKDDESYHKFYKSRLNQLKEHIKKFSLEGSCLSSNKPAERFKKHMVKFKLSYHNPPGSLGFDPIGNKLQMILAEFTYSKNNPHIYNQYNNELEDNKKREPNDHEKIYPANVIKLQGDNWNTYLGSLKDDIVKEIELCKSAINPSYQRRSNPFIVCFNRQNG